MPATRTSTWSCSTSGFRTRTGSRSAGRSRQSTPNLPIVVLTGRDATAAEGSAASAGADAFLHKPFGPLELIDVVERLAGRAPAGSSGARGGGKGIGGQAQLLAHDLRSLLEIERGQRLLLQRAYRQTVTALAAALETKDMSTERHSKRVQRYAFLLAAAIDPLLVDDPSVEYGFCSTTSARSASPTASS